MQTVQPVELITLRIAARIDRRLRANYAEYLEECAYDRKQGHRPHYCEHGTDQWVDFDNICGGCEEGVTMSDPLQRMRRALDLAQDSTQKIHDIIAATVVLHRNGLSEAYDIEPIIKHLQSLAYTEGY